MGWIKRAARAPKAAGRGTGSSLVHDPGEIYHVDRRFTGRLKLVVTGAP
jgi:hypothetical protein